MVDVINPIYNHSNLNHNTLNNSVANDMPRLSSRRPIFEPQNINNSNTLNNQIYASKRYHKNGAPSNGSTAEAYLKSRILLDPIFIHNEASTKYAMISKISTNTKDIRVEEMRFF